MRRLAVSVAAVATFSLLAPAPGVAAPWSEQPRSFVFFSPDAPASAREFLRELRAAGGNASVIYPGDGAVVYANASQLAAVAPYVASRHVGRIDASSARLRTARRRLLANAWNLDLQWRARPREAAAPHGPAPRIGPPDGRRLPVKLPPVPVLRDAPDQMPYGAEYYDTSSYLAGTTAVGVWLLESVGPAYDWTPEEETETLTGVQQGLDDWVGFDTQSANLSFFLDVHTGASVSDDPITYPQSDETIWIGEVLTAEGYTGANAFEQCFQYNNALRDAFETNWCYSIFIVDSDPDVNQGLFAGGGYAWAYFGGPWIYMSRYSTWAYNAPNYFEAVPAHESGHIFWATDEYDDGLQQTQGYLDVPDSPNPSVFCLMNQNVQTRVCGYSKRQVGWRDQDGDGVMEPLDTPPDASLDELLPDPTPDTTPTWAGTATVTTLPNLNPNDRYFPPHDITICTIDAVECRADSGAWSPATPADGAFDAYVEGFEWTAPWLAPGIHVVEARARSSRGIWTAAFGADTVDVEPPVDAPLATEAAMFRLDGAEPNPARGVTALRYSVPRPVPIRLSIHGVDGALIRTVFAGEESAGSHARRWDGRDRAGRPVPAGVYLVRLEGPDGVRSAKLVWRR